MNWTRLAGGTTLILCSLIAPGSAADRPADDILADINAVALPQLDPNDLRNPKALQNPASPRRVALRRKYKLIEELYAAYPENPELITLLPMKWRTSMPVAEEAAASMVEVDKILAERKNPPLFAEAAFFKVWVAIGKAGLEPKFEDLMPEIEWFIGQVPRDPRGAQLLSRAADLQHDPDKKVAILKRIEAEYPDSPTAVTLAGDRRKAAGIGKPFELEFAEATEGRKVSIRDLKGKVVVVDFWATWCVPCVEEMPTMKRLYAEYRGKGVEFIGVSLDLPREQGGLDRLKAYVEKNGVAWPQYYQGKGWESDFSMSWGINAIPCVFLIDADGRLFSTDADGKLETLIPELLKRGKIE